MTVSHPGETAHLLGLSLCTCAGIAILATAQVWEMVPNQPFS